MKVLKILLLVLGVSLCLKFLFSDISPVSEQDIHNVKGLVKQAAYDLHRIADSLDRQRMAL